MKRGAPKPAGFLAVMADRAPADPGELDYFPTPPWAARAGGELIARLDPGPWSVWEPAVGGGHMLHGLADYFSPRRGSDIHAHVAGYEVADFLADDCPDADGWDWIVTNPPFVRGEAFARAAWARARRGVALLLRLSFLEGAARHRLLYEDCPLYCVAPFAERVPMVKGRWDPAASSATAYAWFVWLRPEIRSAGPAIVMPIAPGARERLTRPGDAARFGVAAETPLFEESDACWSR
jgi:hypothetical protein